MFFKNLHEHCELIFVSTSCACRPNTLRWCNITSFLLFAVKKDICIAMIDKDSTRYRIIETAAVAHSGEITSINILKDVSPALFDFSLFCTASSNGELAIWELSKNTHKCILNVKKYNKKSKIDMAKMMAIDSARNKILLISVQFDQIEMQFVDRRGDELAPNTSINFSAVIVLDVDIAKLFETILMAVGLSNGVIDVLRLEKEQEFGKFHKILSLDPTHAGWVRSLAFKGDEQNLWLASSSENIIKLWKFAREDISFIETDALKVVPKQFSIENEESSQKIIVTLESILSGHDETIHSLAWHPTRHEILSSGADKSVFRWQYSLQNSLWLPNSRLGEVGGEEISYYDGVYSPDGRFIICHSLLGGFYLWEINSKEEVVPRPAAIGGHFAEVTDLCWDSSGTYLLTCSFDMTTRIFAALKQSHYLFFEVARPQIHGHILNCLTSINSHSFVSGGEEKIFRIFHASSSFFKNLDALSTNYLGYEDISNLPTTAFQAELTLTNKAFSENNDDEVAHSLSSLFNEVPQEVQLNRLTLFPEIHKLYGHGYEVFSCTSSSDGRILATSCKASQIVHAAIFLWDTENWKLMKTLKAHQLTVTRLAFSMDSRFLLSVSRDRTWTLFHLPKEHSGPFEYLLHYRAEKALSNHARIIWDCAWAFDAYLFATCSRDKTLNLWSLDSESGQITNTKSFSSEEAQTAVDFAPKRIIDDSYLIAIGLEDGRILLLKYQPVLHSLQSIVEFSRDFAHSDRINRLKFRPLLGRLHSNGDNFFLASASSNQIVKIFSINF